jgi:hypothetical protein
MKAPHRHGQVFSGEFVMAFLLFMVSFALMSNLWGTSMAGILEAENTNVMEEMAVNAAEQLIRTPGTPPGWSFDNVTAVGLANESRVLVPEKIANFTRFLGEGEDGLCGAGYKNYDCNLHMLGVGGYDVLFNISHLNGSTVRIGTVPSSVGRPPMGENHKLTVVRTAILTDETVRIYLTIWRNSTG